MTTCLSQPFRYALGTNSTSADFTALTGTTTEPTGAGVFDLARADFVSGSTAGPVNQRIAPYLLLMPFGVGAANTTFTVRVQGYNETVPASLVATGKIYIPQLLVEIAATLSANTFTDHAATTALSDVLTVLGPADNAQWRSLVSTDQAVNTPGSVLVATRGCRYIKFDWKLGTATSMNCMFRPLEL